MKNTEMKLLTTIPRPEKKVQVAMHLYTSVRLLLEQWWDADEAALVLATEWIGQLADELPRPRRASAALDIALIIGSLVVEQDDTDETGQA